ncbi:hypothetical protein CL673_09715 [Candidatus Bathyarchaeota archaeon]|nr:hypothetical protein [Candidatus Bathyarchaeota archaeon]|tara:strand:- start:292 stop:573 length:282 start_codon:yes stop_codon:yes gene_type:complete
MYITSKYISATTHRGSRYIATIDEGADFKHRASVGYNHELSPEGNAVEAIKALIKKINLNEYGIWDSFIVAYGPHGYTAIPSGRGVEHKTYQL